jgi:WD40 repeat protein
MTPDRADPVVILYGLGDPKIITRGVPAITPTHTPHRITFSTDGKWLAAYSGHMAIWPVPGSHMIGGEPTLFPNVYAAAIGPENVLATVSAPSELHPVTIEFWKLSLQSKKFSFFGIQWNKRVTVAMKISGLSTLLQDVSCLAFSPDGRTLAVGSSREGVVQLWNVEAK